MSPFWRGFLSVFGLAQHQNPSDIRPMTAEEINRRVAELQRKAWEKVLGK